MWQAITCVCLFACYLVDMITPRFSYVYQLEEKKCKSRERNRFALMPLLVKRFDLDYGRGDGLPLPPRNGGVGLRQGTGLQLQDKETCRPPSRRPVRSSSSGARRGALPAAMACAVIMRVRCPGLPCEATGASVCCEHVSAGFGIPACATGRMGTRGAARKLGCSGRPEPC